jgi:hypothetical protein
LVREHASAQLGFGLAIFLPAELAPAVLRDGASTIADGMMVAQQKNKLREKSRRSCDSVALVVDCRRG